VSTRLRASILIGPVRSASPVAAPVYLPFVTAIVLPSDVVHVLVVTEALVAVNVPATGLTLRAPWSPAATAIPAATRVASPAAINITLRIRILLFAVCSG
jgi:hypothetical protein